MTRVSVVIPALNAASTLDRTLDSVRAQTHPDIEIILVDDGSTDDTFGHAETHAKADPRVRIIRQANAGVAAARNRGIAEASSDWFAALDADDLWHPETVTRFLAAADAALRQPVMVYTWSRRIDADDRLLADLGRPDYAGDVLTRLLTVNFIRNASATMMDRATVQRIGGYDEGFQKAGAQGAEDIDLYLRLARIGPVVVAPGYHVGYRETRGTMSRDADRMRNSVDMALEKLEREDPSLPPKLLQLARANYDLYAAGLSLSAGFPGGFARYTGRALRKALLSSTAHLAAFGLYTLFARLKSSPGPVFETLDPMARGAFPVFERYMPVQEWFMRLAARPPELDKT
ncbi:glycosyltransferase involved in cell wall biosynthesis [Silicimonas algicola]|uniref:Glycosyltransferase involved in cell wall biosynthesis n=1 Tax=Silicimonas algicola TaxID=1826607 RepID=A0A316G9H5_9RHOB|nr:glycosyltransferase involved in cell wall biosynthesis [Silicimonas algicola]